MLKATCTITFILGCLSVVQAYARTKIVGGSPASLIGYQFYLSLSNSEEHERGLCGATYIGRGTALTAAHCLNESYTDQLYVHHHYPSDEGTVQIHPIPIKGIIAHPDYNPEFLENDIALLFFDEDQTLPTMVPANISTMGPEVPQQFSVVGLGQETSFGNLMTPFLKSVDVKFIPHSLCQELFGEGMGVLSFCAGDFETGLIDSCQGDSGGPLVGYDTSGAVLYGVTSFGIGCAQPGRPGVYTLISTFQSWIEDERQAFLSASLPTDEDSLLKSFQQRCYFDSSKKMDQSTDQTDDQTISYTLIEAEYLPVTDYFKPFSQQALDLNSLPERCQYQIGQNQFKAFSDFQNKRTILWNQNSNEIFASEAEPETYIDFERLRCNASADQPEFLTVLGEFNAIRIESTILLIRLLDSDPELEQLQVIQSCALNNKNSVLLFDPVSQSPLLFLDGFEFAEGLYALIPMSQNDDSSLRANIQVKGGNQAALTLENISDDFSLVGWKLECNQKLLTRTTFVHPDPRAILLPKSEPIKLDLVFENDIQEGLSCSINEILNVDIQALSTTF